MSSTSYSSDSDNQNVLWEQGDDNSDSVNEASSSPVHSPQSLLPCSSQDVPATSPPPTPGLTSPMPTLELSSQESIFFPSSTSTPVQSWKRGKKAKRSKFHGNRYTSSTGASESLDSSVEDSSTAESTFTKPRPNRLCYTIPRRGYISKYSQPFRFRKQNVHFERTSGRPAFIKTSIPTGMRILDIGILAEAISLLSCQHCSRPLTLYESDFLHGWQTTFYIKCKYCHRLHAEFPSSKPIGCTDTHLANVPLPKQGMNEVTMRSVLAVHSSGSSWRDLHKFASIFGMPPPYEHMPPTYLNKIETVAIAAAEESMLAAAEELHVKVDSVPSPVPGCLNIAVSFDSSWKTRGFYSNIGFGSAISASTGKVLDYVLLNRTCEKCNRWPIQRQERQPEQYQKWYSSHKDYCLKNFSGSSQAMEPEAAKIIWNRSVEKRKLCYDTFIGDGDSKSYQRIIANNPYNSLPIHKEECIAHVSKRLKKNLCKVKKNTTKQTYVQHKLTEHKAEYVSSNFSTVVFQNRGKTPNCLSKAVGTLLTHISGDHSNCPEDTCCKWRIAKTAPTATTNFTSNDIAKVTEVFQTYGNVEFCSHLTLGMTQNKNESLHNVIWNFCPKSKYISPQSVRISTAIAVTIFNEGEVSLYGIMKDLKLNPTHISFSSLCKRELLRQRKRLYIKRANVDRRTRRQRTSKQRREQEILKLEGGKSYCSSSFGAETFQKPKKVESVRGRGRGPSRGTRIASRRGKGVKRRIIPAEDSEDSLFTFTDSDTDSSNTNVGICGICGQNQPPQERHRSISKWSHVKWVMCDLCNQSFHQCCAEIPRGVDISDLPFICFNCS